MILPVFRETCNWLSVDSLAFHFSSHAHWVLLNGLCLQKILLTLSIQSCARHQYLVSMSDTTSIMTLFLVLWAVSVQIVCEGVSHARGREWAALHLLPDLSPWDESSIRGPGCTLWGYWENAVRGACVRYVISSISNEYFQLCLQIQRSASDRVVPQECWQHSWQDQSWSFRCTEMPDQSRLHHQMMQSRRLLLKSRDTEFLELTLEEANSFAISDSEEMPGDKGLARLTDLWSCSGGSVTVHPDIQWVWLRQCRIKEAYWVKCVFKWDSVNWKLIRSGLVFLGLRMIQHW